LEPILLCLLLDDAFFKEREKMSHLNRFQSVSQAAFGLVVTLIVTSACTHKSVKPPDALAESESIEAPPNLASEFVPMVPEPIYQPRVASVQAMKNHKKNHKKNIKNNIKTNKIALHKHTKQKAKMLIAKAPVLPITDSSTRDNSARAENQPPVAAATLAELPPSPPAPPPPIINTTPENSESGRGALIYLLPIAGMLAIGLFVWRKRKIKTASNHLAYTN
jgi:hypothetical protein